MAVRARRKTEDRRRHQRALVMAGFTLVPAIHVLQQSGTEGIKLDHAPRRRRPLRKASIMQ
jgi:hypothetical protein